jgi:diketogulonate reductase-like aldo/keto reductase
MRLGTTDTQVPLIGLGTSGDSGSIKTLRSAVDAGACLIDTAELYGNEELIGAAARGMRDRFFIATKVWKDNLRPDDLLRAADRSLRRLQTDYIDLYQVHWPDPRVPLSETIGAMEDLVDSGRVRFIGVSNFSLDQVREAVRSLNRYPLVSNQVEYSLIDRHVEQELLSGCREMGITIIAYSPLGAGLHRIERRDRRGALQSVAQRTGRTSAQVALNWCIGGGGVIAIPRASSSARIRENCAAAGWRLSAEDRRLLETSIRPRRHRGWTERELRRVVRQTLQRSGPTRSLLDWLIRR